MTTDLNQDYSQLDHVTVKPGVFAPACRQVEMSGWTGRLVDWMHSDVGVLCMVAWDTATIARMPDGYRAWCDAEELGPEIAMLLGNQLQKAPPPSNARTITLARSHSANPVVQSQLLVTHS